MRKTFIEHAAKPTREQDAMHQCTTILPSVELFLSMLDAYNKNPTANSKQRAKCSSSHNTVLTRNIVSRLLRLH